MKEEHKKAFDFASDVTKQLITLSTAIIAITITFSKDLINFAQASAKGCLFAGWVLYICTVAFGIWTLLALAGNLQPMKTQTGKGSEQEYSINSCNVRLPSMLQILCFIAALILTIIYGINSLS